MADAAAAQNPSVTDPDIGSKLKLLHLMESIGIHVADIGLPGEDCYAFIRRVRRHSSAAVKSVPAIAVTAYATATVRLPSFAGFINHISCSIPLADVVTVTAVVTTPFSASARAG